MKPTEQPAQRTAPERPLRPQSAAGLYGEVLVLPLSRPVAAPLRESRSFL